MMRGIFPQEHVQACPARGSGATYSPPSSAPPIFLCPIVSNGLTAYPIHTL